MGSWVVRMLLGMGIKEILVVDDDVLDLSDRERHCLFDISFVGRKKIDLLSVWKERLGYTGSILGMDVSCGRDNYGRILEIIDDCDFVFDCIDGLNGKAILIKALVERKKPFICSGGVAQRMFGKVEVCDVLNVRTDPLIRRLRTRLRKMQVDLSKVDVVCVKGEIISNKDVADEKGVSGRKRKVLGSWIVPVVSVSLAMVEYMVEKV